MLPVKSYSILVAVVWDEHGDYWPMDAISVSKDRNSYLECSMTTIDECV